MEGEPEKLEFHSGFVDEETAQKMQSIQSRQFLRSGVTPTVGQRVELSLRFQPDDEYNFSMSGQVVEIKGPPEEYFPMENPDDRRGSLVISAVLGAILNPDQLPDGAIYVPCSCDKEGCEMGTVYLPKERWDHNLDVNKEFCQDMQSFASRRPGAKHGQEIVCEGRLNFDYDMRRGSEEGPWDDGIPLDGRDIWSWTLVFNDHMVNMWVLKPNSFTNLGRDRHPRCWPWTNEDELPYERTGIDRFDYPLLVHLCVGPFGCDGRDHDHNFAGAA